MQAPLTLIHTTSPSMCLTSCLPMNFHPVLKLPTQTQALDPLCSPLATRRMLLPGSTTSFVKSKLMPCCSSATSSVASLTRPWLTSSLGSSPNGNATYITHPLTPPLLRLWHNRSVCSSMDAKTPATPSSGQLNMYSFKDSWFSSTNTPTSLDELKTYVKSSLCSTTSRSK